MDELSGGIRRVTLPLPTRPGHVHAYVLPGDDGWTVVDTGLGLPDARERWARELHGLPGRVRRIVVTHFHPDHVGAARDLSELTGAAVLQGRVDYEQCELVWGGTDWASVLVDWFHRHGVPDAVVAELIEQGSLFRPFIRFQPDPELIDPGDEVDGWRAVAAPGHADGQLMLIRDGVLVAADHVLDPISPTVGLWPRSRPDPLGDYIGALRATAELGPTLALPGHGEPIADPVGRVGQLIAHHEQRLGAAAAALRDEPQSGYEVSFPLFGDDLKPSARRFAVAETLSHLERLVLEGGARRIEDDGGVSYTSTP
jgi:glyoxylase-like metal-dependent hydrolase (beta-lactamase superfamily II)